jgi:hypothetical protein
VFSQKTVFHWFGNFFSITDTGRDGNTLAFSDCCDGQANPARDHITYELADIYRGLVVRLHEASADRAKPGVLTAYGLLYEKIS